MLNEEKMQKYNKVFRNILKVSHITKVLRNELRLTTEIRAEIVPMFQDILSSLDDKYISQEERDELCDTKHINDFLNYREGAIEVLNSLSDGLVSMMTDVSGKRSKESAKALLGSATDLLETITLKMDTFTFDEIRTDLAVAFELDNESLALVEKYLGNSYMLYVMIRMRATMLEVIAGSDDLPEEVLAKDEDVVLGGSFVTRKDLN